MSQHEHEHALWTIWRHTRVTELTHPFGWTSLTAQHWLHDGDTERVLDGLPGSWSFDGEHVTHHPSLTPNHETHAEPALTIDGVAPTTSVTLPRVAPLIAQPRTTPVILSGGREIETVPRRTASGGVTVAIRVRDPQSAASACAVSVPTFAYDPAFRVASELIPHDPTDTIRETVAENVIDVVQSIGTLRFTLNDLEQRVLVFGRPGPHGLEPFSHVRDLTTGSLTHDIGRSITLQFSDAARTSIEVLDLNYLHSMPCAFTPYVSCPLPVPENSLDIPLLSGEQTPVVRREGADHLHHR